MISLSLDQAGTTGYAVADEHGVISFGTIVGKGKDYYHKARDLRNKVDTLIKDHKVSFISFEDVFSAGNKLVYKKLSGLLYILVDHCITSEIDYVIYSASQWRSKLGIPCRPRAKAKQAALDYVNNELGLKVTSDDEAEAICASVVLQRELNNGD